MGAVVIHYPVVFLVRRGPLFVILGAPQLPRNPGKFQRHSKVTKNRFPGFPSK